MHDSLSNRVIIAKKLYRYMEVVRIASQDEPDEKPCHVAQIVQWVTGMLQHSSSYFLSTRAMSCGCNHLSMDSAHIDAGTCRTDQHTVLWRIDKALLGQDEPFFKLHYSRQGNLKLTGMSYCS